MAAWRSAPRPLRQCAAALPLPVASAGAADEPALPLAAAGGAAGAAALPTTAPVAGCTGSRPSSGFFFEHAARPINKANTASLFTLGFWPDRIRMPRPGRALFAAPRQFAGFGAGFGFFFFLALAASSVLIGAGEAVFAASLAESSGAFGLAGAASPSVLSGSFTLLGS
jgi:hypothetical protein